MNLSKLWRKTPRIIQRLDNIVGVITQRNKKTTRMIEKIDIMIKRLLEYRDSELAIKNPKYLRSDICIIIEKAYFLEALILKDLRYFEPPDNQFFIAHASVNRQIRDWGLDEVADIYNELREMSKLYITNIEDQTVYPGWSPPNGW